MSGINITLVKKIADELGLQPVFNTYPFKRILSNLKTGDIDIACSLAYKDERAEYIDYLKPAYGPSIKIFLHKKNKDIKLEQYNDLYKYSIGLRLGNKHFTQFDNDEELKKQEVDTGLRLFKMLMADRVDLIIGTNIQILHDAKTFGYSNDISIANFQINKGRSGHCGLSKKSKYIDKKADFERLLKGMLDSGEIDRVINAAILP